MGPAALRLPRGLPADPVLLDHGLPGGLRGEGRAGARCHSFLCGGRGAGEGCRQVPPTPSSGTRTWTLARWGYEPPPQWPLLPGERDRSHREGRDDPRHSRSRSLPGAFDLLETNGVTQHRERHPGGLGGGLHRHRPRRRDWLTPASGIETGPSQPARSRSTSRTARTSGSPSTWTGRTTSSPIGQRSSSCPCGTPASKPESLVDWTP